VSNYFISLALTFELVFPENRLLSVLLLILNLLAALETLGVSQEHRNAIASSIAFMFVEISHLEVVLMMDCGGVHCSGVCMVPGNLLYITFSISIASTIEHQLLQQVELGVSL
jgi:hypothetical protein